MATLWKTEYHVITVEDGDAVDWCDTLEKAKTSLGDAAGHIDAVKYYHNDTVTVFSQGEGN